MKPMAKNAARLGHFHSSAMEAGQAFPERPFVWIPPGAQRAHLLTVSALLAVGLGCSSTPVPAPAVRAERAAPPQRVAVVAAARTTLASDLSLMAEFRPFQEVDVMAKVTGYLQRIEVDVGTRVQQGQLLAVLEVPEMADELAKNAAAVSKSRAELERARQEVARAQTAREMTQLSHSRLASVMEKRPGLVAQQEIDTVRNRDLLAQAQIAAAQSTLAATEQSVRMIEAEQARLRTLQGYTRVTAPFDGIVTRRFVDTGAMIQAGSSGKPIVRIAQIHILRLVLPIPEAAVPRLKTGTPVAVRVDSLGRTFSGRIARLSSQIQTATRTMDTEVDVPNPAGILVPGMFAEVRLRLDERRAALSVPAEAVERSGEGDSVVLVGRNHQIERRSVKLGLETADRVEILGGLTDGDLVVIGNRSQLRAGQKVDPKRVDGELAGTAKGRG